MVKNFSHNVVRLVPSAPQGTCLLKRIFWNRYTALLLGIVIAAGIVYDEMLDTHPTAREHALSIQGQISRANSGDLIIFRSGEVNVIHSIVGRMLYYRQPYNTLRFSLDTSSESDMALVLHVVYSGSPDYPKYAAICIQEKNVQ